MPTCSSKNAFDIPTHKGKLQAWLKAGFMEEGRFHPTEDGTPQGEIPSPTAANR